MLTVIITAGGTGKRMGTALPKQFMLLGDKPVLQHTLEAFYRFDPQAQLLLTLPADWVDYWQQYCTENNINIPHQVIAGGAERFHSIREALHFAIGNYIAVHDGVRPLIDTETIRRTVEGAHQHQACIPVIPLKDSIRRISGASSSAENRSDFVLVQTPQVFEINLLRRAYEQAFHPGITDDASLVESLGSGIHLVDGDERNIKITTQSDLDRAAATLLK